MNENYGIIITFSEAERIIAFIDMHDRLDIPDELWDLKRKLWEAMYT